MTVSITKQLRELGLEGNERTSPNYRMYDVDVAEYFGDKNIAIFLHQLEFRWLGQGKKVFYKYFDECDECRPTDSWAYELGLSVSKIHKMLKVIGTPANRKDIASLAKKGDTHNDLVFYKKVSRLHRTLWAFNIDLYNKIKIIAKARRTENISAHPYAVPTGPPVQNMDVIYNKEYSKNIQREEKEKEIYKEKEKEVDMNFKQYQEQEEEKTPKELERERKKREKILQKANKGSKSLIQQKMIEDNTKGKLMPLDFSLSPAILLEAVEKYADIKWIKEQEQLYINYYTNVNPRKMLDFQRNFIDGWLKKAKTIEKEREEKYGTPESSRSERLRELAKESAVSRAGTTDVRELARRLRDKRRGNGDNSS
jgi:hypothetical protein